MELKITIDDASIARLADAIAARLGGETSAPPKAAPAAPAAASVTLGDLRGIAKQVVGEMGAAGREALVSILSEYGAKNLTTLDESKFAEVADRLKAKLGG